MEREKTEVVGEVLKRNPFKEFEVDTLQPVGDSETMRRWLLKIMIVGPFCFWFGADARPLDTSVLTNIAIRYDLPMPPKGVHLVLAHTESWQMLGNSSTSRDPAIYSPAFLLEENSNGTIVILSGAERKTLKPYRSEPTWRPFSIKWVKPKLGGYVISINRLSAFVCAVQLARIGREPEARQIWDSIEHTNFLDYDRDYYRETADAWKNPSLLLGSYIYEHLQKQILEEPTAWLVIRERMTALLKEFPTLRSAESDAVLSDLTATLEAKPTTHGSTEALVLEWSRRTVNRTYYRIFDYENEADAPARAVALRGADAVPDLLALLNDRRISAHSENILSSFHPHILRVGELAGSLLSEITGCETSLSWQTPTNAAPFRAWLENVRKKGEEATLAESVFRWKGEKITFVNETPVRIIAEKYPERLVPLCAEFTERATAEAQPFALSEAIADCRLPSKIRVQTLAEFAQKGSLEQREWMLASLAKIDPKRSAGLLLPVLDNLPRDTTNAYWTCPEAQLGHVVAKFDDAGTWRKYLQVTKGCAVGLRMEIMNSMECCCCGGKDVNHNRRLAFLAAFLDDNTTRRLADDKKRFDGPCAAFTIPKISVQNFAAMQLASMLDLKEYPDEFWDTTQWSDLRKKVREELIAQNVRAL